MKSIVVATCLTIFCQQTFASVDCPGRVNDVYKWHNMQTLSFRIKLGDGQVSNWISLPTKSDESMALMAFASNKPIHIYWAPGTITSCVNGWDHNTSLNGYFVITSGQ
jgi:hypothetical protein